MNTLDRAQIVARLKQLPSLPAAVSELLASFENEDVDVSRIAQLIGRDQGLTARVLRVANSSFYGLQSRVSTINEAVVVLGFRAVRSMVLAVGLSGTFRGDQCKGFDALAQLRHGIGVGLAARALAKLSGHNAELAFTAGILHDVGQLVLAANFSKQYAATLAYRCQHDCLLVVAERDVLSIDHGEVGGLLAEVWRFPPALREALAEHHAPANAPAGSLADVVHVADAIAHGLGLSQLPDEMVMPVDRTAWQRINLDDAGLASVLARVVAEMEETCQALTV